MQVVCKALFDLIWLQSAQTAVPGEPEVDVESFLDIALSHV